MWFIISTKIINKIKTTPKRFHAVRLGCPVVLNEDDVAHSPEDVNIHTFPGAMLIPAEPGNDLPRS